MIRINIGPAIKLSAEESLFINFEYNIDILEKIREIPQRFFHGNNKTWELPTYMLAKFINWFSDRPIEISLIREATKISDEIIPKTFKFKTKPYQHQIDGLKYGLNVDNFVLGDDQGLGKTKQIIDIAVAKKQSLGYKHCLIICGVNNLKWNWEKEIETHSNEESWILGARYKKGKCVIGSSVDKLADLENLPSQYFLITNKETLRYSVTARNSKGKKTETYPIMEKLKSLCESGQIDMIAFDEMHKCKNPQSQEGKALLKIRAKNMIALSGTPIMNSPLDAYMFLKWLGLEKHSYYEFKSHFSIVDAMGNISGYKNLDELRMVLDSVMLRRLKTEVLDLPDKIYVTEYVEMCAKQAKIYNEVKTALRKEIDKIKLSKNPMAEFIRLRQATAHTGILSTTVSVSAKMDRMEELVQEAVERNEKVIIFSNWTQVTDQAEKRLHRYNPTTITGQVGDYEKQANKGKFQGDNSCKVIIGTYGAMGTGLTLTAANNVICLDEPWNKANKEQAIDRAHRIGQDSKVTVTTLVCKDTIDEKILQIVENKGAMSDLLVDGRTAGQKQDGLVNFLLEELI